MSELMQLVGGLGWGTLLAYCRIQAFVLMLPGVGERIVPARVRVALAMAISPLIGELLPTIQPPSSSVDLLLLVAGQMLIGFAMGGTLRLLALAIDVATSAIAAAASLSQIVGGANEASPHPIGNLLHLGGLAVLFSLGFPVLLIDLIVHSFMLWPIGGPVSADGIVENAIAVLSRSFSLALLMAAPFILGGFLFQALSGVVNKVMPALPVVFIGAPGQIMLALFALVVLAPLLVGVWADAMLSFTLPGRP